jgi:predicted acyl esterase
MTRALLNQGEPYTDPALSDMLEEIQTFHSSYSIDDSQPPAPLLIQNGWTDDLFPVDEALRFYNRTKTNHPRTPVSLFFADIGHMRAQNKPADERRYASAVRKWLRHYVKGKGRKPFQGVQALTETCPSTAPSAGPYKARSWAALSPGEVRLSGAPAQTILPTGGDPAIGRTFDAVTGNACATVAAATQPGVATYLLDVTSSFTLLGSPTVVADFTLPGATSQVAARLLDVGPDGKETLVARGLWRPQVSGTPSRQVFQLHPGAWQFAPGHRVKLELLPDDAPYGRASNGQQPVTVANLELRLPTRDKPGANTMVQEPLAKVVPPGHRLARGYTGSS